MIRPTTRASIVPGDLRCGNRLLHPAEPHVLVELHWGFSMLGRPLADRAHSGVARHSATVAGAEFETGKGRLARTAC